MAEAGGSTGIVSSMTRKFGEPRITRSGGVRGNAGVHLANIGEVLLRYRVHDQAN